MKETLRILFSAAFLSTVFLCAYNYVNSTADDRQNSITSFWGNNTDKQDENESSPADDSFSINASDPLTMQSPENVQVSQSDPFNDVGNNTNLPLSVPESQQATPSGPYGYIAPDVSDNLVPPMDDPSAIKPLVEDTFPDSPITPIAPIDPEVPNVADTNSSTLPTVPNTALPNTELSSSENAERLAAAAFIEEAKQRIARGEIRQALLRLSQYYNAPQFTPSETNEIHAMLMRLAGEVIYLHPEKYFKTYVVQPGDTITSIAAQHQIPWQLVAKINGITAPYHVNPGEQVKVVQGPFNAEIHLDKYELTLWLPVGDDVNESFYAGTFPIGLGGDCPRLQGDYIVDGKYINPEYPKLSNNPTTFGPGDANNPYGKRLMSLMCVSDSNHVKIGIHGTNNPQNIRQSVPYGFICLGARDINDLYDILSVGSRVKIER